MIARAIALVMIAILLSGCARPDTDVTSSDYYKFKPFAGTVWKTKVKVTLTDVKRYNKEHALTVFPDEIFDKTKPDYRPVHNAQIISVFPAGIRVRIERLMKDNGNWGGVRVTAILDEGGPSQKTVYLDRLLLAKNRHIW